MTLQKLTPEQRKSIHIRYREGWRLRQLCCEYGVSQATIKRVIAEHGAKKGPSAATIQAARERALASIAGTYAAPAPVKITRASRFVGRVSKPKDEPALRNKSGSKSR